MSIEPNITSLQYLCNISKKRQYLRYLKKELSYEVDAYKHESLFFLQVDTINFDGIGQACPKYWDKFAIS